MSLVLKDITKSYGERRVLDGFSYKFNDKGVYVLRGESGAGKTTLMRIIAGLENDFSGKLKGRPLTCAVAFQEYRLFPTLSALDNVVTLAGGTRRESINVRVDAARLLTELGFSEREMQLKPSELSGGMKQRVSIARALLASARVVLLDEPTKELDPNLCEKVNSIIRAEAQSRLIIVITHRDADIVALGATVVEVPMLSRNS